MNNLSTRLELYLLQKGCKSGTIRKHLNSLRLLQKHSPTLDYDTNLKYFLNLLRLNRKAKYVNSMINTLRVLSHIEPSIKAPPEFKEEKTLKATFSDKEIEAFLALPVATCRHVSKNGKVTERPTDIEGHKTFTMFWSICAYSGMRMGEVASLTVDRVDFGRGVFILEDTKTNTPRFVPIAPNICKQLQEFVNQLSTSYLFPSQRSKGCIDNVDWHYNFKKRIERLGIKRKGLTPYSFRHSMCTRLLEEDISFPKVMKIMGHTDPKTTLQYEHLTTRDIQKAITKHPLIRRSTSPENILKSLSDVIRGFSFEVDDRFSFSLSENGKELSLIVTVKE